MRILVLQHLAVEHPGMFRDFWTAAGHRWDVVELDQGETIPGLAPYDLMVVMGGPMDVWQEDAHPWLVQEKAAIRDWVGRLGRPFLGVCLGHQLLAEAMGGRVAPGRSPEVGPTPVTLTEAGRADPLFAGLGPTLDTFQWHGAEVAALPPDAEVLAANEACAVQALRVGARAYGLQFHIELTDRTVPEWQAVPEYAASLEQALGAEGAATLEQDTAARLPGYAVSARRLNDALMALVAEA